MLARGKHRSGTWSVLPERAFPIRQVCTASVLPDVREPRRMALDTLQRTGSSP